MTPTTADSPTSWRGIVQRFLPTWLALVVAAVVVDLAMVAAYVHFSPGGVGRSLAPSFPLSYKNWVMWAVFAPSIILLVHRMLVHRWSWSHRLAGTVALAAGLALAHALVEMELHRLAGASHEATAHGSSFFSYHLIHGLLTFLALYATALLVESERVAHAREVREVQLRQQVSAAQLQTLRMQLQPHFLFNTLNSVSALVEEDVRGGQHMISRLSEFLRATLGSAEHREVPLADELALLATYVEIERIRFGERLRVEYDVAPDARDALVPNLILQPLVENAIRHGIQPSLAGGVVTVRARRDGDRLAIAITDDGVGVRAEPGRGNGTGVGLANTRERLRQCYGDAAALRIEPGTAGGTVVLLRLPFTAAVAAAR